MLPPPDLRHLQRTTFNAPAKIYTHKCMCIYIYVSISISTYICIWGPYEIMPSLPPNVLNIWYKEVQ